MLTKSYDGFTVESVSDAIKATIGLGYTPIIDIGSVFDDYRTFRLILTGVKVDDVAKDVFMQLNITRFFYQHFCQLYNEILDLSQWKLNSFFIHNMLYDPNIYDAKGLVLAVINNKFKYNLASQIQITNSILKER